LNALTQRSPRELHTNLPLEVAGAAHAILQQYKRAIYRLAVETAAQHLTDRGGAGAGTSPVDGARLDPFWGPSGDRRLEGWAGNTRTIRQTFFLTLARTGSGAGAGTDRDRSVAGRSRQLHYQSGKLVFVRRGRGYRQQYTFAFLGNVRRLDLSDVRAWDCIACQ